jgi:hypothetical protein
MVLNGKYHRGQRACRARTWPAETTGVSSDNDAPSGEFLALTVRRDLSIVTRSVQ